MLRKVRNIFALIGALSIALLFGSGHMNHFFYRWQEISPGIYYKLVKYPNGESIKLTADLRDKETWRIHLPCADLPNRMEVRTTWPNSSTEAEEVILCNGRTIVRPRGLLWYWWFMWVPQNSSQEIQQLLTSRTLLT